MTVYGRIQELRTQGYSKRRAAKELAPDKRTVGKYWDMSEENYARYTLDSKERDKLLDPYREDVVGLLEAHSEINSGVIETNLRLKYDDFAPSARSVRLYAANLREELGLPTTAQIRQYSEVEELPMGFQAQVDMGQEELLDPFGKKVKIYIFCMSLSCSRYKFRCFWDKPYNAEDFVKAHDLAFRFFGGRTDEIVCDQDRVALVSENGGDLILTDVFRDYVKYAGFKVRFCRGYDPESKGKIEAVVKYVKNNFLAVRTYFGLDQLNSEGLKWLERVANAKLHDAAKMVPARVFIEERSHLGAVPTLSEPPEPNLETGKLRISDVESGQLLAEHSILFDAKGKKVSLPKNAERYRETKFDDLKKSIPEHFAGSEQIGGFLDRIHANYARYARDQYGIIVKAMKTYSLAELNIALNYCVEHDLYSAPYLRETLVYLRGTKPVSKGEASAPLPAKYENIRGQERSISAYERQPKGGFSV